jgi:CheY-like chemotaxis protein
VVETEPQVRSLLEWVIEGWGYDVTGAGGGREALAALDRRVPSLIVLDTPLPDMEAAAFAAELEGRALRPSVPILALGSGRHGAQKARQIAAEGYLPKPVTPPELFWKLERLWKNAVALQERLARQQDAMAGQVLQLEEIWQKTRRRRMEQP